MENSLRWEFESEKRPNFARAASLGYDLHNAPSGKGQRFSRSCLEAQGGADLEISVKRDCLWARVEQMKLSEERDDARH